MELKWMNWQSYNSHKSYMYGIHSHADIQWWNLPFITHAKTYFLTKSLIAILVYCTSQTGTNENGGITVFVEFIWAFNKCNPLPVFINQQPSITFINAPPEVWLFLKCLKLMWLKPQKPETTANSYSVKRWLEVFKHNFKIQNLSKFPWSMHTLGWKPLSYIKRCREKSHTQRRGSTLINIKAGYPFFNSTTEHIPASRFNSTCGPWNSHVDNQHINNDMSIF